MYCQNCGHKANEKSEIRLPFTSKKLSLKYGNVKQYADGAFCDQCKDFSRRGIYYDKNTGIPV